MNPQELKEDPIVRPAGPPFTDFDANGGFNPACMPSESGGSIRTAPTLWSRGRYRRIRSLTTSEFSQVIKVALNICRDKVSILAGASGRACSATSCAQQAERLGAKGVLLHYLTETSQDDLVSHVGQICSPVNIGVIVYNRGVRRLTPNSLEKLAAQCPNLIGLRVPHRRYRTDGADLAPHGRPLQLPMAITSCAAEATGTPNTPRRNKKDGLSNIAKKTWNRTLSWAADRSPGYSRRAKNLCAKT